MVAIKTHYDNLQVTRTASPEVIRAAYKGLTQRYHPDRHPEDRARCERVMKIINDAFAVLSDPGRRAGHDAWIAEQEAVARAESVVGTATQAKAEVEADGKLAPARADDAPANNAASYTTAADIFRASRMNRDAAAQEAGGGYAGPLYNEYQPPRPPASAERIAAAREAYRAERAERMLRAAMQQTATAQSRDNYGAPAATPAEAAQTFQQSQVAPIPPDTLRQASRDMPATESPRQMHDGRAGNPVTPSKEPVRVAGDDWHTRATKGRRWAANTMKVFGIIVVVKLFFAFKSNQFRELVEAVIILCIGLVVALAAFGLGWLCAPRSTRP